MGLLFGVTSAAAQQPLYLVNGVERSAEEVEAIAPEIIEQVEELPADEVTIARYGERASNGVVLVQLKYDEPARFVADTLTFTEYLARTVRWDENEPVARVQLRYRILTDGRTEPVGTPNTTNKRLLKRVLQAMEQAPRWEPARRQGEAVEVEGVLTLQLPVGRRMLPNYELVIR